MSEAGRTLTYPPPSVHPSWLAVEVAGQRRRLALGDVRWVGPVPRVTRVPGAAAAVRGVIAWRGRVLALYDLGSRAARPSAVVLEAREGLCALVVDRVLGFVGDAEADGAVLNLGAATEANGE